MSKIFISYRREDSPGYVGRLQQTLEARFRPKDVFVDLGDIAPGKDFGKVIGATVGHCQVLLVLIGPYWLTKPGGQLRDLTLPDDYVRFEIVAALDRGITVIPVLVGGAKLPDMNQLPADMRPLLSRQAMTLSDVHWAADSKRLMNAIAASVDSPGRRVRAATADLVARGAPWFRTAGLWIGKHRAARIDPVVDRIGKKRLITVLAVLGVGLSAAAYVGKQNAMTPDRAREALDLDSTATRDGFFVRVANKSGRAFCATIKVELEAVQGRTTFKSAEEFTQTWKPGSDGQFTVPYQTYKGELDLDRPLKVYTAYSVQSLCD